MKLSKNIILALAYASMNFFLNAPAFAASNAQEDGIQSGDINILADIAAIDKTEILLATIASNKNLNKEVLSFAKLMIVQHGANLTQLLDMVHHFHLASLNSSESNQLSAEGNQGMMTLGGLQGDQFAKEYINAMVKGHQAALDLIDNQLMKTAKTESIKKFLSDTRVAVVQHLEHAQKLQKDMPS